MRTCTRRQCSAWTLFVLLLQDHYIAFVKPPSDTEALSVGRPSLGENSFADRAREMKIRQPDGSASSDRLKPQIVDSSLVPGKSDVLAIRRNHCPQSIGWSRNPLCDLAGVEREKVEFFLVSFSP